MYTILSLPIVYRELETREGVGWDMERLSHGALVFVRSTSFFDCTINVVHEQDTGQQVQLLYHSQIRPDCSPWPPPHSWLTATSFCQTGRGTPSSSYKYPSNLTVPRTEPTSQPQLPRFLSLPKSSAQQPLLPTSAV